MERRDRDQDAGADRPRLLGPTDIRELAGRLGIRPSKRLGQNFVVDAGTVSRITALAGLAPDDVALEVGPGLGSLTLPLLAAARRVIAVEIDPVLAAELPRTVADRAPGLAGRLTVLTADAARLPAEAMGQPADAPGQTADAAALPAEAMGLPADALGLPADAAGRAADAAALPAEAMGLPGDAAPPGEPPTALVANLPYNVAVPVVLHLLAVLPSLRRGLVMVQAEVADRMSAPPGSRTYGAPSAKLAWYATVRRAGSVPRNVFWPVPRVDSGLVAFTRREPPSASPSPFTAGGGATREEVFAVVDAAFSQRRKTLRAALAGWAGSAARAERLLRAADIDPGLRGEALGIADFARIAAAKD